MKKEIKLKEAYDLAHEADDKARDAKRAYWDAEKRAKESWNVWDEVLKDIKKNKNSSSNQERKGK